MLIFILILVIFFLIITVILLAIKLIDSITSSLAPAISTPSDALGTICSQLKISDSDEVWELGCGDARVICYCAKKHPGAKFVGIENGIIMFTKAKWRTRHQNNVQIIFGNIKSTRPKTATKMYLYLLPTALQIVKPTIPKGCMVVSLEFKLPKIKPSTSVKLPKASKFAHRLYIYKF